MNPADGTIEVEDDIEPVTAEFTPLREALEPSFPARVWETLSAIDVKPYVRKKGKLDYLPWAPAWRELMKHFPESSYEFDAPHFFDGGTGEQWVTVRIVDGSNVMERRWWLPYMTHTNQAAKDVTATQINATRMRVLVKALAMCGLGTDVYAGEDIPDETQDATPVSSAPWTPDPALIDYAEALRAIWGDGQDVDMFGFAEVADELSEEQKRRLYQGTRGKGNGYLDAKEKQAWRQAMTQHKQEIGGTPKYKPLYDDDGNKIE